MVDPKKQGTEKFGDLLLALLQHFLHRLVGHLQPWVTAGDVSNSDFGTGIQMKIVYMYKYLRYMPIEYRSRHMYMYVYTMDGRVFNRLLLCVYMYTYIHMQTRCYYLIHLYTAYIYIYKYDYTVSYWLVVSTFFKPLPKIFRCILLSLTEALPSSRGCGASPSNLMGISSLAFRS